MLNATTSLFAKLCGSVAMLNPKNVLVEEVSVKIASEMAPEVGCRLL